MLPRRIKNANVVMTAPDDWDESKHGKCVDIAARATISLGAGGYVETAWEPTPDELACLMNGGSVVLRIFGRMPPVAVYVEPQE